MSEGAPRRRTAQPAPGVRLCALGEISEPGAKGFSFREGDGLFQGLVVRAGGEVRGFLDRCPHAGFPLALIADRYLTADGQHLICATHGALFRLDGLCVGGPCAGARLVPWEVRVADGAIWAA
ncbi:MAG: Rieske (2Fe-2S) protein [Alphaproteobacteria bacterium]|nr:Rieske (2Fe-2S) protein [Alphaproteobacteria bacterium]